MMFGISKVFAVSLRLARSPAIKTFSSRPYCSSTCVCSVETSRIPWMGTPSLSFAVSKQRRRWGLEANDRRVVGGARQPLPACQRELAGSLGNGLPAPLQWSGSGFAVFEPQYTRHGSIQPEVG